MSKLDTIVSDFPLPTWRALAWPIIALLGVLIVWAKLTKLDEVAVASGVVAPQSKTTVIQHDRRFTLD